MAPGKRQSRISTLGAHVAVNYKEQDFVAEVQKFTDKRGVDVIIENVATDNLAKDLIALAPKGRIIVIGTGTGKAADAAFPVFPALFKDASALGMSLINAGAAIPEMAATLARLFGEGKLKAVVSKSYSLADARKAIADLMAARLFGKLVLTP